MTILMFMGGQTGQDGTGDILPEMPWIRATRHWAWDATFSPMWITWSLISIFPCEGEWDRQDRTGEHLFVRHTASAFPPKGTSQNEATKEWTPISRWCSHGFCLYKGVNVLERDTWKFECISDGILKLQTWRRTENPATSKTSPPYVTNPSVSHERKLKIAFYANFTWHWRETDWRAPAFHTTSLKNGLWSSQIVSANFLSFAGQFCFL